MNNEPSSLEHELVAYARLVGRSLNKGLKRVLGDLTEERRRIIEPNLGSDLKIEGYLFAVNMEVPLDDPGTVTAQNSPDVTFRIREIRCDVPEAGILTVHDIRVANVSCIVGGSVDAFTYRDGLAVDLPTLSPANRVTVIGSYTGKIPAGRDVPSVSERKARVSATLEQLLVNLERKSPGQIRSELKDIMRLAGAFLNVGFTFSGPATIVA